ncbi:MAG: hypothetical protein LLF94_12210 [Chlamydiales bacterium]|nr:hypothetical protein [Chlamydiales bacterium]
MVHSSMQKNKINLSDYPYKKDIANRLFLSELSQFEIAVLEELLFQPSKCRLSDILDTLDCDELELESTLKTFSKFGLILRQHDMLYIDKDLKKCLELHSVKFSKNFEPSFERLQGLLNRVPISILPTWYSLPRTSDNIFISLVEKYLQTPKIYETYLRELTFDDTTFTQIIAAIFASEQLQIEATTLCAQFSLTREKLQEYILLLEFNFIATSYYLNGKKVVTAFSEYKEYVLFQRKHALKALDVKKVVIEKPAITVSTLSDQEEAMRHFRNTINEWHDEWNEHIGYIEKSVFELERALRIVPNNAWVTVEDFIAGLITPIGFQPQVTLQRTGKKWRYQLPAFNQKEKAFIELVIFDLLQAVGISTTGTYDGKPCFQITPFGRVALGEA